MRHDLFFRSFLPFAARFLYRHPTKLALLRQHWSDYSGRFDKLAGLASAERAAAEEVLAELELHEPLFSELNGLTGVAMHPVVYYGLVRLLKPDVVVETGVCDGYSSRFILLAMERNRHGRLCSIDFPNQDVELGVDNKRQRDVMPDRKATGWLVPSALRSRWSLHLGDAKVFLPQVLESLGHIDIFIHDSLHTYEHMMFEFRTAWPRLRESGLLLADDCDWNPAFREFATGVGAPTVMFNARVGAIRKSAA